MIFTHKIRYLTACSKKVFGFKHTMSPRDLKHPLQTALEKLMSWNNPFLRGETMITKCLEAKENSLLGLDREHDKLNCVLTVYNNLFFYVASPTSVLEARLSLVIMDNPTRNLVYLQTCMGIYSVPSGRKYSLSLQHHF